VKQNTVGSFGKSTQIAPFQHLNQSFFWRAFSFVPGVFPLTGLPPVAQAGPTPSPTLAPLLNTTQTHFPGIIAGATIILLVILIGVLVRPHK